MTLLETINDPTDLRKLKQPELTQLADEMRQLIVDSVSKTGGHLSSNLGTVELTIALHHAFNTPEDRLIWDVGHQTYPHKILTGRRDQMSTLRQFDGIPGSQNAMKVSMILSARPILRRRFPLRSAWHWLPAAKAKTVMRLPLLAMVRSLAAWRLKR